MVSVGVLRFSSEFEDLHAVMTPHGWQWKIYPGTHHPKKAETAGFLKSTNSPVTDQEMSLDNNGELGGSPLRKSKAPRTSIPRRFVNFLE
jgi:hypothetical protein